jgi:hypothetical protein
MAHERSVFSARNAALLGVVALIAFLSSADVAVPPQTRLPGILVLMFFALGLVLWNRVAPLAQGGARLQRVPRARPHRRRAHR